MDTVLQQLWVKEPVPDPLYVDLFDNLRDTSIFRDSVLETVISDDQKDDTLAAEYLRCGHGFIQQNDYKAAVELYNKSLCFAENGTDAVSLAYASRSFCFFEFEMYDECISDIELAIQANCPEKSMKTLEIRKLICLKAMKTSAKRTPAKPQLSFASSDTIQSMANVLTIERNDKFGRHFKAKCNIPEDRVILIEEPLMRLIDSNSKYKRCNSCLKQYTNLIPCAICTKVLFCRGECADSASLHKYECNMKHWKLFDGSAGSHVQSCVKFSLRAVVRGLETFSSSGELMEYVEFTRADNDINQVIIGDGSFESMLGIFLSHHDNVSYMEGRIKILIIACVVYDYIMGHLELKDNFLTEKVRRFLMHLVTQFVSIYSLNNILLQDWSEKWSDILDKNSTETFGAAMFNISSYFNHACMPNAIRMTTVDHSILTTIRPINKGEQIFVRYAIDANWPTAKRQKQLFRLCEFKCECMLCLCNGPLKEISIVSSEFENLSAELASLIFLKVKETDKWATAKDKLFKFVKKYEALPTKSIILAYEYIRMILVRDLSLTTNV
ncbi:uncharacterized protein LOC119071743 [Bradysia coprophila]|uniref:uncharacterized protein LOC119071743 n=1 Tax=Bradysia coprophila TaxID=38358 RepID=UPI00187D83BA|nr:uncharacterized protein LOC119071743 [Bradysia coprophila]